MIVVFDPGSDKIVACCWSASRRHLGSGQPITKRDRRLRHRCGRGLRATQFCRKSSTPQRRKWRKFQQNRAFSDAQALSEWYGACSTFCREEQASRFFPVLGRARARISLESATNYRLPDAVIPSFVDFSQSARTHSKPGGIGPRPAPWSPSG